jgi:hypothetical protein
MSVAFNVKLANPEKDIAYITDTTTEEQCHEKLKFSL